MRGISPYCSEGSTINVRNLCQARFMKWAKHRMMPNTLDHTPYQDLIPSHVYNRQALAMTVEVAGNKFALRPGLPCVEPRVGRVLLLRWGGWLHAPCRSIPTASALRQAAKQAPCELNSAATMPQSCQQQLEGVGRGLAHGVCLSGFGSV